MKTPALASVGFTGKTIAWQAFSAIREQRHSGSEVVARSRNSAREVQAPITGQLRIHCQRAGVVKQEIRRLRDQAPEEGSLGPRESRQPTGPWTTRIEDVNLKKSEGSRVVTHRPLVQIQSPRLSFPNDLSFSPDTSRSPAAGLSRSAVFLRCFAASCTN